MIVFKQDAPAGPASRGTGLWVLLIALSWVLALAITAPAYCADDVAVFLEQHGLKRILAVHLEQQLAAAPAGDERTELIERLAALYAELLASVSDPGERLLLEEKSSALLQQAPARSGDRLRLELLRVRYRAAEQTAENHRLRLSTEADLDTARRALDEIIPELEGLRKQIKANLEISERRETRAGETDAAALSEAAQRDRILYGQATFLTAWALYYQSWLSGVPAGARAAEPLFAEMLQTESPAPEPGEVSVDLRELEAVARSILGMGLCKSLTASTATAIAWIDLLRHESAFEALREQAPVWAMVIHLEHKEYRDVIDELERERQEGAEVPLAWLRLVAVYSLEDRGANRHAEELARESLTELATRGELGQVLDLATRYGTEALGTSGFAFQYVKGVIDYQKARVAHGGEDPTFDREHQRLYQAAATALQAALGQPDAKNYAAAAAACQRLVAWCLYFQGRFLDARAAFEQASAALIGDEAAEALWMAIVSLDRVVQSAATPGLEAELIALMDRFLAEYPSSPLAPKLILKQAALSQEPSDDAIEDLLAIPANSEVYLIAQRRAADYLYRLFRAARSDEDRAALANRFLNVAVPIISETLRTNLLADSSERDRFAVLCRQALEVSLHEQVKRLSAARSAFTGIDALAEETQFDLGPHRDELDVRRVQLLLYEDEPAAASELGDALWERDRASIWARIAVRDLFKYGHGLWKNPEVPAESRRSALEILVRYGGRVLHEFKDDPEALNKVGAFGYYVAVAEGSMALWEESGDAERGQAALFLYERLLTARPDNAAFLRAVGVLAQKVGKPEQALEAWRKLVAGLKVGEEGWYEAKHHLIEILATNDPERARMVMDQHKRLNPEYGPEPWGPRLKALDEELQKSAPAPEEAQPESGDGKSGTSESVILDFGFWILDRRAERVEPATTLPVSQDATKQIRDATRQADAHHRVNPIDRLRAIQNPKSKIQNLTPRSIA